mgnify:CR=1 FL=1
MFARQRILHSGDATFSRFLDILHHRFAALFYRAWAQAQPTVSLDRPDEDRFAGYVGALVAEESIQMHGGIGMTWELPLAHYAKRLVLLDHQFGDEDHHLERFMALSQQA